MFVQSRRPSRALDAPSAGPGAGGTPSLLSDGLKLSKLARKAEGAPEEELGGLEKRLATLKQGLFGVLFVMARDASAHHLWHLVLVFFHFSQVTHRGGPPRPPPPP